MRQAVHLCIAAAWVLLLCGWHTPARVWNALLPRWARDPRAPAAPAAGPLGPRPSSATGPRPDAPHPPGPLPNASIDRPPAGHAHAPPPPPSAAPGHTSDRPAQSPPPPPRSPPTASALKTWAECLPDARPPQVLRFTIPFITTAVLPEAPAPAAPAAPRDDPAPPPHPPNASLGPPPPPRPVPRVALTATSLDALSLSGALENLQAIRQHLPAFVIHLLHHPALPPAVAAAVRRAGAVTEALTPPGDAGADPLMACLLRDLAPVRLLARLRGRFSVLLVLDPRRRVVAGHARALDAFLRSAAHLHTVHEAPDGAGLTAGLWAVKGGAALDYAALHGAAARRLGANATLRAALAASDGAEQWFLDAVLAPAAARARAVLLVHAPAPAPPPPPGTVRLPLPPAEARALRLVHTRNRRRRPLVACGARCSGWADVALARPANAGAAPRPKAKGQALLLNFTCAFQYRPAPAALRRCHNYTTQWVTYAIYGHDPIYVVGLFENIARARRHLPGWTVHVYLDRSVPAATAAMLRAAGALVTDMTGAAPYALLGCQGKTLWRFEPLRNASVTRFLSRDADDRLTARDGLMAREWVASGRRWHVCRRPEEKRFRHYGPGLRYVAAGLFGAVGAALPDLHARVREAAAQPRGPAAKWTADQWFLRRYVVGEAARDFCGHTQYASDYPGWSYAPGLTGVTYDRDEAGMLLPSKSRLLVGHLCADPV